MKVLFVIPAYNEEENIEKVLKEIKDNVDFADIVVVNDCSTDNTKDVVLKNGVRCIDGIFNLKYAGAVQTGLKYAYQNDYDYVIQFDADGQHIASEAVKLVKEAEKTGVDIVIGSRYLKDTGYPCPFFRRVGTKIFEFLVKIFCHKRIVARYSKMGGYPEFPDANLVIDMLLNGYSFLEVPVKMRLRETGESMHGGIIKPIKYMFNMFYTIFFILIQNFGKKVKNK